MMMDELGSQYSSDDNRQLRYFEIIQGQVDGYMDLLMELQEQKNVRQLDETEFMLYCWLARCIEEKAKNLSLQMRMANLQMEERLDSEGNTDESTRNPPSREEP